MLLLDEKQSRPHLEYLSPEKYLSFFEASYNYLNDSNVKKIQKLEKTIQKLENEIEGLQCTQEKRKKKSDEKIEEMIGLLQSAQIEIDFLRVQLSFLTPAPHLHKFEMRTSIRHPEQAYMSRSNASYGDDGKLDLEQWSEMYDNNHALREVKALRRKIDSMHELFT